MDNLQKTAKNLIFRQIHFGSEAYEQAFTLRDCVLRQPIGLRLGQLDREQDEEQLHYALLTADGSLLASLSVDILDRQRAKIRQMVVDPAHQGRGLGQQLMQQAEAALIASGLGHIALHARVSAVPFYQKLGYQPTGPVFEEVGITHQRMEKLL